ncbi:DUF559 domain-containing protein [uncultured Croceitalea sp.]|uniref:DUF559 domain-containing protein n=1 Tax=uncultured Croceitalea sp. TaxID=1798908 RepID=UPI0033066970
MNYKIQLARLLRKEQTTAEKKLWQHLRNRKFENLKFRRQHPIKKYIVDFFCEAYGIVIELDGEYHNDFNQKEIDNNRDMHLNSLGYIVLRFENNLVFKNPALLFQRISEAKHQQQEFFLNRRIQLEKRNKKKHLTPALSSRRGSHTILSTKILSLSQKELLLNAGIRFVEYDAISIEFLAFELVYGCDFYLFTSQNAVKSFLANSLAEKTIEDVPAFCVGQKTKALLESNGITVEEMASNASDLASLITKEYRNHSFLFFCGNLRRDDIPRALKDNNVRYKEIEVYKTTLNTKHFETVFDGVLFFSPTGVHSFTTKNALENSIAFCIGKTTLEAAKKYTQQLNIANKPTVENVLVQAIKAFSKNTS